MQSYRELIVWQKSIKLVIELYSLTKEFPKEEIYGITSQMRRAAISISSNIAEGYSRGHKKEFKQFLRIAFGSGAELETQLLIAKELKLISAAESVKLEELLTEVMKMLNKMSSLLTEK